MRTSPASRVLAPATVDDARGMLAPALADPDPVVIFEHAQLYNMEGRAAATRRAAVRHQRAPRCAARAPTSR